MTGRTGNWEISKFPIPDFKIHRMFKFVTHRPLWVNLITAIALAVVVVGTDRYRDASVWIGRAQRQGARRLAAAWASAVGADQRREVDRPAAPCRDRRRPA